MSRPSTRSILVAVAAGGMFGAYLRLGITDAFQMDDGDWPSTTLTSPRSPWAGPWARS